MQIKLLYKFFEKFNLFQFYYIAQLYFNSFMTKVPITYKSVHGFYKLGTSVMKELMDGQLYIK